MATADGEGAAEFASEANDVIKGDAPEEKPQEPAADLAGTGPDPTSPSGEHVEVKLFVGRIPQSYDSDSLRPVFEAFGPVLEVAIIKDRSTGQHKGSAFVRMQSLTDGDKAIRELNGKKSLDNALGTMQVRYAAGEAEKLGLTSEGASIGQDEAKLFVGCISKSATEEEVRNIFSAFGRVNEVFIMKEVSTAQSRGCAFIKFAYKEHAILAINKLNGQHQMAGAPRPMEVRFAESKRQMNQQQQIHGGPMPMNNVAVGVMPFGGLPAVRPMGGFGPSAPKTNANPAQAGNWREYHTHDGKAYYHNEITNSTQWERPPEFDQMNASMGGRINAGVAGSDATGPPGANVFVFHVPNDWGYNEFLSMFINFGRIVSARLAIDQNSGRNKGFGFISYDDVNAAVQCVAQMNGFMVQNKKLKVAIKKGEEQYVSHLLSAATANAQMGMGQPVAAVGQPRGMRPQMGHPGVGSVPMASGRPVVQPYQQFAYR